MFRLNRIDKAWREAGSLNEQVNLFGFIDDQVFLTKSGDVGILLRVDGVDYECLDSLAVDHSTKRLEAAFRILDEKCRVYQMLFKRNGAEVPHRTYDSPVVDTAIRNRIEFLKGKAESLYSLEIYYAVLFEGFRYQHRLASSISKLASEPGAGWRELRAYLSNRHQVTLIACELERARAALLGKVRAFILQVGDFLPIEILSKQQAFSVLKRLLNFDPLKIESAQLKYDTFLDCQLSESHLECHRGYLRLDDYFVKVLTLKEPSGQSFPLIFKRLLEVSANYFVVTEWQKQSPDKSRRLIHSRRRHFHNTKRSLMSQVTLSDHPERTDDILTDDSKEAQVRELGLALQELELKGNYFGEFSVSVVIYDLDLAQVERACSEFYKVFSVHDGALYEESYNLLNAYLASVPGNCAFNLRKLLILNTNYADYSFLFSLHSGDPVNAHLRQEYLAVLETNHQTPYYLNLHARDVAHTMILGQTGAGKSFLLNFLITNLQKYAPHTFVFDLGGSFESLTQLFGGAYVRVGMNSLNFRINPFSLPVTKANLDFLALFVKVLAEGNDEARLTSEEEQDLYHQIENLYEIEPELRTLGTLANTLPRHLARRFEKWTAGGQFGFLFDNPEDTITFSRFQCFDFQGMSSYPDLLEPLLFYILHRANDVIADREISHLFKTFFIDEAWIFFRNPAVQTYIVEALKTWRKQNAAMVLSTQSLDELRNSQILDVIVESCPTKIFLANPGMDSELYREQFHLNDTELELISTLIPKRQMLIKKPGLTKVANLEVDPKSYWLYTNDPYDNRRRREAFEKYGFEKGLAILAGSQPEPEPEPQSEVELIPTGEHA
jgi:type IV secretion/conjugal transfer VirB4 family ATPase